MANITEICCRNIISVSTNIGEFMFIRGHILLYNIVIPQVLAVAITTKTNLKCSK